jgi:hypothetical protein
LYDEENLPDELARRIDAADKAIRPDKEPLDRQVLARRIVEEAADPVQRSDGCPPGPGSLRWHSRVPRRHTMSQRRHCP